MMRYQNGVESDALILPRYLDGQDDQATRNALVSKGAVASRISSLNEMNSTAAMGHDNLYPALKLRAEGSRQTQPMHVSKQVPLRLDAGHEDSSCSGNRTSFVRRSASTALHMSSDPSVPDRVAHHVPSALVQRPTFSGELVRPAHQLVKRDDGSMNSDVAPQRCVRQRNPEDVSLGAGSSHTRSTAKRFEELGSRRTGTKSRLESGSSGALPLVGQRQNTRVEASTSKGVMTSKSEPGLHDRSKPVSSAARTTQDDERRGLTADGILLQDTRSKSPSISIGPRTPTSRQAKRVCTFLSSGLDQIDANRSRESDNHVRGIESIIHDIDTMSTSIEDTAREIRTTAHLIGLLYRPSAITSIDEGSMAPSLSSCEMQGSLVPPQPSPIMPGLPEGIQEPVRFERERTANPASNIIGLSAITLASHGGDVNRGINQLQTINGLSPGSRPIERENPLVVGHTSKTPYLDAGPTPTVVPPDLSATMTSCASPREKRTVSIREFIHAVDVASGERPYGEINEELHRPNVGHNFDASSAKGLTVRLQKAQEIPTRPGVISPNVHTATSTQSMPSVDQRSSTRNYNGTASARNDVPVPESGSPATATSRYKSLPRAPLVYFPYQHLSSMDSFSQTISKQHEQEHITLLSTASLALNDTSWNAVARTPETPPPPPPRHLGDSEIRLGFTRDPDRQILPPAFTDYRPTSVDCARAVGWVKLEHDHGLNFPLTALSMPVPMLGRVTAGYLLKEEPTMLPTIRRPVPCPLMPGKQSTTSPSTSSSSSSAIPPSSHEICPSPPLHQFLESQSPHLTSLPCHSTISPGSRVFSEPGSPLLLLPSASHSPSIMATMTAATVDRQDAQPFFATPAPPTTTTSTTTTTNIEYRCAFNQPETDCPCQFHGRYPPPDISQRVRMLEDARRERMQILRVTGAEQRLHSEVIRRFNMGISGPAPGDRATRRLSLPSLSLSGPMKERSGVAGLP